MFVCFFNSVQVDSVDYLNNFITALSNDNVIETQFPSYRRGPESDDDEDGDFDIDSARGDMGSDDMNFGQRRKKGEYLTSLTDAPRTAKEVRGTGVCLCLPTEMQSEPAAYMHYRYSA